jgi:hypothetical protein
LKSVDLLLSGRVGSGRIHNGGCVYDGCFDGGFGFLLCTGDADDHEEGEQDGTHTVGWFGFVFTTQNCAVRDQI